MVASFSSRSVPRRLRRLAIGLAFVLGAHGAQAASAAPAPPPAQAPAAAAPAASQAFTVAVIGDGFADALVAGLRLNYAGQQDVAIVNKAKTSSGLSQDARSQWPAIATALLAGPPHIDAGVVMVGFDDSRPLRDGQATIAPGTPRWSELYGDRVEALAATFRDKHVPLIWVGLPVVAEADMSAKFAALNEIVRDRAVKAGASYVDSWAAFVDENGKYAQTGPDVNGQTTRLRMSDGIDFTREGARKLASFVDSDLRRARDQTKSTASDPTAGLVPGQLEAPDADINALIRREAGLPALPSSEPDGAAPATTAGPVVPLTAPALAQDGILAAGAHPAMTEIGGTLAQRALVQGQPIPPQPGRMDDFSWPHQP